MRDDRELLELAAKAAGIVVMRSRLDDPICRDFLVQYSARNIHHENGAWNPMTDDGDRYRLAKKLDIRIHFAPGYVTYLNPYGKCGVVRWPEDATDDAYAIVIAAAEIGRSIP